MTEALSALIWRVCDNGPNRRDSDSIADAIIEAGWQRPDLTAARSASKAVADETLAGENRELHTEVERLTEENDRYGIELDLRRDEIHRLTTKLADLRAAGHIVYVTPTRIACVPECTNPGKHLDEERAVNRD
jgi:hypothetical protein